MLIYHHLVAKCSNCKILESTLFCNNCKCIRALKLLSVQHVIVHQIQALDYDLLHHNNKRHETFSPTKAQLELYQSKAFMK